MYSNDRADAAGGCDADGTALLAAMGLDGLQPAQTLAPAAAAPAKRKVSQSFVLLWKWAGSDIFG